MKTIKHFAKNAASLSLTVVLMTLPKLANADEEVTATNAASCVGRVCTIEGLVANVVTSRDNNTIIKLAGTSPNPAFNAVITANAVPQFHAVENYEGRKVRITGLVKMHRGIPATVLVHASQLVSVE